MYTRGHWRPAEDEKLKELVTRYGPHSWNVIAEELEGRSGKSCRLRWFNQLDPRINRSPFTAEEEERLLASHRVHGNRWAAIARLFPGRTDNAVKNHWHVVMARRYRKSSRLRIHSKRAKSISHDRSFNKESIASVVETHSRSLPNNEELYPRNDGLASDMTDNKDFSIEFYDFLRVNAASNETKYGSMGQEENGAINKHLRGCVPFIDFLEVGSS